MIQSSFHFCHYMCHFVCHLDYLSDNIFKSFLHIRNKQTWNCSVGGASTHTHRRKGAIRIKYLDKKIKAIKFVFSSQWCIISGIGGKKWDDLSSLWHLSMRRCSHSIQTIVNVLRLSAYNPSQNKVRPGDKIFPPKMYDFWIFPAAFSMPSGVVTGGCT